MTQPPPSSLYNAIEKLRLHMQLRVEDVLLHLGVSRPTYYGWKNGRKMNSVSSAKALTTLRNLMSVAKSRQWLDGTRSHTSRARRKELLDELLHAPLESSDTGYVDHPRDPD